jgi:AraC family transcriptional regulator
MHAGGDMDIVPAGERRLVRTDRVTWELVVILHAHLLHDVATRMGMRPEKIRFTTQLGFRDEQLEPLMLAIRNDVESREPLGRLYAEGLATALTSCLLERHAFGKKTSDALAERRLRRALEYIEENLPRGLSLSELATVAGMSPSHFKVLFKRGTGLPVHRYVIQRRVELAASLLTLGDEPLTEVAYKAGFADQSHMARWMRRLTGQTPTMIAHA